MEPGLYQGMQIQFRYPENWTVSEESDEGRQVGVSLESPQGAFFSVNRFYRQLDTEDVLRSARESMEQEYKDLESDTDVELIAGEEYETLLVRFYYLDLLVISQFLAIELPDDTLLVQFQAEDRDFDQLYPVYQAMVTTLIQSLASPQD